MEAGGLAKHSNRVLVRVVCTGTFQVHCFSQVT
jgi:hypothetical protein